MKPTTKLLLAAIVLLLITYWLFVLIYNELNPQTWTMYQRAAFVVSYIGFAYLFPVKILFDDTKH